VLEIETYRVSVCISFCVQVIERLKLFACVSEREREKERKSVCVCLKKRENSKALRNWKIFLKALSKRLRKLTIKTKRLWQLKFLSFVNVND